MLEQHSDEDLGDVGAAVDAVPIDARLSRLRVGEGDRGLKDKSRLLGTHVAEPDIARVEPDHSLPNTGAKSSA